MDWSYATYHIELLEALMLFLQPTPTVLQTDLTNNDKQQEC